MRQKLLLIERLNGLIPRLGNQRVLELLKRLVEVHHGPDDPPTFSHDFKLAVEVVCVGFNLIGFGGSDTDQMIKRRLRQRGATAAIAQVTDHQNRPQANAQEHHNEFGFDAYTIEHSLAPPNEYVAAWIIAILIMRCKSLSMGGMDALLELDERLLADGDETPKRAGDISDPCDNDRNS